MWNFLPIEEMGSQFLMGGLALMSLTLVNLASYYILGNIFEKNLEDYRELQPYQKKYVLKIKRILIVS